MEREIDTLELIELMKKEEINLIDIRDNYTYLNGTIKNAKNIPANYLITRPMDYLDNKEKYYIFCNYGTNSRRLCSYLSEKGYHVVNIIGGYHSYLEDSR